MIPSEQGAFVSSLCLCRAYASSYVTRGMAYIFLILTVWTIVIQKALSSLRALYEE
jgi:hypothetical protein